MAWKTDEERTEYIRNALKEAGLSLELVSKITGQDELAVTKEVMKLVISDVDRRVNKAVETTTEKLKKETGKTDEGGAAQAAQTASGTQATQGAPADSSQPEFAKIIADTVGNALKPITDRIDAIEREKAGANRSSKIRDALKEAGLSESYEKYITVDDEAKITDAVEAFKGDLQADRQAAIDEALAKSGVPARGNNTTTVSEDSAKDFAQLRNKKQVSGDGDFPTVDVFAYKEAPSQTGASKI